MRAASKQGGPGVHHYSTWPDIFTEAKKEISIPVRGRQITRHTASVIFNVACIPTPH